MEETSNNALFNNTVLKINYERGGDIYYYFDNLIINYGWDFDAEESEDKQYLRIYRDEDEENNTNKEYYDTYEEVINTIRSHIKEQLNDITYMIIRINEQEDDGHNRELDFVNDRSEINIDLCINQLFNEILVF